MADATLAYLVGQMYQDQEVLEGWDAVLNLLESSVNSFFQAQWKKHTENSGQMSISTIWCEGVHSLHGTKFTNVTQFDVVLGPPLFQFQSGQASVTVTQDILSGSMKTGTKTVSDSFKPTACGCPANDPSVQWGDTVPIDSSKKPSLSGTVPLEQVQGLVANANSLILDFAKGAFTLNHLAVKGVADDTIVEQLKSWFATNDIKYIVASLNSQDVAGQPALTPTSFRFNVTKTNAGNTIVQLLITTNGTAPESSSIKVNEPIPTADGYTCSLMISSRILFQNVLAGGFDSGWARFKLVPVAPSLLGQAWHTTITPKIEFSGQYSFGSCCAPTTVYYTLSFGWNFTGSPSSGFALATPSDMPGLSVNRNYPVSLSGTGRNQVITIVPGQIERLEHSGVAEEIWCRFYPGCSLIWLSWRESPSAPWRSSSWRTWCFRET